MKNPARTPLSTLFALACAAGVPGQAWDLVRPGTSGIPGEEVRMVRFAPDGQLWVGARWPFWTEGGFGIYDRAADEWTTWSNGNGRFPSAFPNDLAWASDGSCWIATGNGLVHWDHGAQTVYTTANAPLLHNSITAVDLGADGHVWVVNSNVQNNNAALFEYDGRTWRSYRVGEQLPWNPPWNNLSDVLVDHLGHVWVANEVLNGVAEYDGVAWTLRGGNVGRFGEIEEDTSGNLWLRAGVGGGNAFWKYDRSTFTTYPASTTPTAIGIDDDGAVFLGDWNGTIRKTIDGGRTFTVWASGLNQVFDIAPDPAGTDVWVGTIGAVGHFNGAGALLRDYNTYNTGVPDYFLDRFSVDRTGNFWVACGEGGLSRYDGHKWRNWGAHNAGSEPYPFAGNEPMGGFYLDSQGRGWMGGNGIARWDPATGTFHGFWNWQNTPGLGVTQVWYFAEDLNGALFAATEYGAIFRFNGTTWLREPVQPYATLGLPGMQADAQGNVWIAAWFDVWKWNGTEWGKIAQPNANYFFDLGGINCMAIGPDDVKWFGTAKGLVRYDGASFQLYDRRNTPLPAASITGVDVRADGVIGLAASDFGAVTPFPNGVAVVAGDPALAGNWLIWQYGTSPLPHYQLGGVRFDADGNLWVSAISEGAAVLLHPAQALRSDRRELSASVGGTAQFALDAGSAGAGRSYLLLGTLSGIAPGTQLPGGVTLPINLDAFTSLGLSLLNTPVFQAFYGTLDGAGRGSAAFALPRLPFAVGLTTHFAFTLVDRFDFASNAVAVALTP